MLSTRRLPRREQADAAARGAADADAILVSLRLLRFSEDLTHAFARYSEGRLGLSSGRLALLLLLERAKDEPPRLADLARRMRVSRPTVTRLVAGLAAARLVVYRPDPDDGRARRVDLSAEGRHLLRRLVPAHARRLAALTHHLTQAERREFERLLEKVRSGLGALRGT
jgi:DNA-binding MarR family transcriptional regulator